MSEYCVKISDSNPVAVVVGGSYDGKVISILKDTPDTDRDPFEQLDIKEFIENFKLMDIDERMEIVRQLKGEEKLKANGKKFKEKFDESCANKFKIDSGQFNILPSKLTERVFIAGASGSGKSTIASMYIHEYKIMFPKNNVYLLSTHDGEKAYDVHEIKQIKLDSEFLENPPTLDDLTDSLVIFDDADNLQDKKIQKAVNALNSDLISNGRKYNIHVLSLAHQLMDYSRTRLLLIEANRVIFFLNSGKYHTQRYLRVYAGLDQKQIRQIIDLKSRWVCLSTGIPNYYISQYEVGLIGNND